MYDFLSLKNDVNVASKSNKQKSLDPDPDPLVIGTDPRIWIHIRTKMQCCGSPGSGMGFFRIPDLGSQTHSFESLVTMVWVKSSIIL